MKQKILIGIGLAGVLLVISTLALRTPTRQKATLPTVPQQGSESVPSQENASELLAFSFEDYNGKQRSLSDFSGTPLVVNAWAAWCPFCKKELADFATVQEQYKGRVVFIAIDRAESRDSAKSFTDTLGVTERMVFLLDPNDRFYRSIGGFSMPETLFVDTRGHIVYHKRGPMDLNEIQERTKALIE